MDPAGRVRPGRRAAVLSVVVGAALTGALLHAPAAPAAPNVGKSAAQLATTEQVNVDSALPTAILPDQTEPDPAGAGAATSLQPGQVPAQGTLEVGTDEPAAASQPAGQQVAEDLVVAMLLVLGALGIGRRWQQRR